MARGAYMTPERVQQVALKPYMEFYRVKFGPFRRLYMEASDMDGAIRFTPTGERE